MQVRNSEAVTLLRDWDKLLREVSSDVFDSVSVVRIWSMTHKATVDFLRLRIVQ